MVNNFTLHTYGALFLPSSRTYVQLVFRKHRDISTRSLRDNHHRLSIDLIKRDLSFNPADGKQMSADE